MSERKIIERWLGDLGRTLQGAFGDCIVPFCIIELIGVALERFDRCDLVGAREVLAAAEVEIGYAIEARQCDPGGWAHAQAEQAVFCEHKRVHRS